MKAAAMTNPDEDVYKELKQHPNYHRDILDVLNAVDKVLPHSFTGRLLHKSAVLTWANYRPKRTLCVKL